jgi:hypothetical protein
MSFGQLGPGAAIRFFYCALNGSGNTSLFGQWLCRAFRFVWFSKIYKIAWKMYQIAGAISTSRIGPNLRAD